MLSVLAEIRTKRVQNTILDPYGFANPLSLKASMAKD
jgi:hypothetical protein